MTRLQTPPILAGSEKEQLMQLRSYLFTMSRQLEQALGALDETNFAPGSAPARLMGGGAAAEAKAAAAAETGALRALIVKSADAVRAELDSVTARLDARYAAASDYGSFTESMSAAVDANARQVTAVYDYCSRLEGQLDSLGEGVEALSLRTGGSIRAGIVGFEADGLTPIFGLAVGQDVTSTTVTVDGVEYERIDPNAFLSVFTADRLSFRQNDVEVAYLSNEKLYITTAHVSRRLELADKWSIDPRAGLAIKWIGG